MNPGRPLGGVSCTDQCRGHCSGHYLTPEQSLAPGNKTSDPPPTVITKASKSQSFNYDELSKDALLPTEEVKLCLFRLDSVANNHKCGAMKIAPHLRTWFRKAAEQSQYYDKFRGSVFMCLQWNLLIRNRRKWECARGDGLSVFSFLSCSYIILTLLSQSCLHILE